MSKKELKELVEASQLCLVKGGKRAGVEHHSVDSDWFVSVSPRNNTSNAEGPWQHWVNLAVEILRHEFTKKLFPNLDNDELLSEYITEERLLLSDQFLIDYYKKVW